MKSIWVIDLDNIDHKFLLKSVTHYTKKKHILLYVKRCIEASVELPDGNIKQPQGRGTPQGGVISPVLANIFMDIVFDKLISKRNPEDSFERYAEAIIVNCRNIKEALRLLEAIKEWLKSCKLELNIEKTNIVYCRKDQKYQQPFKVRYQKSDFLSHTFKPRMEMIRG
jgi:retron-type reverse transcriptase